MAYLEPQQNVACATRLREMADLLAAQEADGFRVLAYRRAADTVETLATPVEEVLSTQGIDGLDALPGIGKGIAAAIAEMVKSGHWSQLERLRGTLDPEKLFQTIPGIGPALAKAIIETLDVDTLEALETAAHDGRLAQVKGIGRRRAQMARAALSERLGRSPTSWRFDAGERPSVPLLLEVDREYRQKAEAGTLPKIAPRRFNPTGAAWLPILHTRRGRWTFTALYSNTARANRLERVRDWVIITYHTDHSAEGQCTIVTELRGALAGQRVVRGRENRKRTPS